jgi:ribosomal protein S1
VRVRVLEVNEADRRMSLSLKAVPAAEDSSADAPADAKPAKARKRPLRGGLE